MRNDGSSFESIEEAEEKILKLEYRLAQIEQVESCQQDYLSFVRTMWPEFIAGRHHKIMAEKLERVASGELKRLIINMPPRHTKSEFASIYFPSWMMGLQPNLKIMQTTHTADLSINFGRKVRNLMDTEEYTKIFQDSDRLNREIETKIYFTSYPIDAHIFPC